MTGSKKVQRPPTINVGGWDGAGRRLAPLARGHNIGAFALPPELVRLMNRATEIEGMVAGTAAAVREATVGVGNAPRAAARRMIAGELERGGGVVASATDRLRAAREDNQAMIAASKAAGHGVRWAIARLAGELGRILEAALIDVLNEAEPEVPLLGRRFDYADPGALVDVDEAGRRAWSHLDELAQRHDVIRQAAAGIANELRLIPGGAALNTFRAERFGGFGLRGPVQAFRNSELAPWYQGELRGWTWQGFGIDGRGQRILEHPVERLAAAAAAPWPLVAPDVDEDLEPAASPA